MASRDCTGTGCGAGLVTGDAGIERRTGSDLFVGAIERAERNITLASAEKIARALDMTVADLLTPQNLQTI